MQAKRCPCAFDETLISGYLDAELTQAADQKVRVHLEDCADCRSLLDELKKLREATMSTEFRNPDDTQWNERPRGTVSRLARGTGWILTAFWAVTVAAYALWEFWRAPTHPVERLLVVGGLSALTLLFVSVLLDRIKSARTDPYREIEK
ncbi:MAG: anti-sigma factor [Thermoanaerobaculales bacterium]